MAIEADIARLLRRRGLTLAVAESCTGGLLGQRLTARAGSSTFFAGGVIAYADRVKTRLLGVSARLLAARGAVSAAVARQMARGARRAADADVGVGITGIAGPGGGTAAKPVGLVFVAAAWQNAVFVRRCRFRGSRAAIRRQAATAALELVMKAVAGR